MSRLPVLSGRLQKVGTVSGVWVQGVAEDRTLEVRTVVRAATREGTGPLTTEKSVGVYVYVFVLPFFYVRNKSEYRPI